MEESKLKSKCYFCENKFSHNMVIFGFDPAQTQICHAKNDNTNVQAPGVTIIKDGIVPFEAEKTTEDNTTVMSTTTSGQHMDFRYTIPKLNKKKEPMAAATSSDSDSDIEEMRKKYLKPVETPEKKKVLAKVKKIPLEAEKTMTDDTSVISTTTYGQLMDFRPYKIPKLNKKEEDVRSL